VAAAVGNGSSSEWRSLKYSLPQGFAAPVSFVVLPPVSCLLSPVSRLPSPASHFLPRVSFFAVNAILVVPCMSFPLGTAAAGEKPPGWAGPDLQRTRGTPPVRVPSRFLSPIQSHRGVDTTSMTPIATLL